MQAAKCSSFFSGYEVPDLEKTLDCVGRDRKELGLPITQEQIDELKSHATDINYDVAKARERKCAMTL